VAVEMIEINLLPAELRPRPRSPLPYLMTIALAIAVVMYCLIAFVGKWRTISDFENRIAELDVKIEQVRDSVNAVKQLEDNYRRLSAKRAAISTIVSDRILWSKVLYMLPQLVPDDVWLSDLKESVQNVPVTIENPDPEARQRTITKNITIRRLEIAGYALSPREERGVDLVGQFVRAMEDKNDPKYLPEFATLFRSPVPQSVVPAEFDRTTVKKFEIWCNIAAEGTPK